jgi:D-isomer specific 2-hydroxyacid dehydrogenase, NAD binding domain
MRYRSGAQRERRARPDGPLRVIAGRERFSEQHGWSEMPRLWPAGLASRVAIEAIQDGRLEERLTWGGLARRLSEAPLGFRPGRWGEPAGRSLAGTTACVIGTGAIGVQIAHRLTAFGVTVTGVRRRDREVPPFTHVFPAGQLTAAVAGADAVIIAASHQAGSPPVVDDAVLPPPRRRPDALPPPRTAGGPRHTGVATGTQPPIPRRGPGQGRPAEQQPC